MRRRRPQPGPQALLRTGTSGRARQPSSVPALSSGGADGACLIEPAVRCTHCGYCQSGMGCHILVLTTANPVLSALGAVAEIDLTTAPGR